MGVILMGPAGSGKTVLWRALADAYAARGLPLVVHAVNPKATPRQRLLGSMDLLTRCVPARRLSHATVASTTR